MKVVRSLYFWILVAFVLGTVFGLLNPDAAAKMEILGTNFIKLIKIFIGPIIFVTVVSGIAQTGCVKKLGKIGIKAFIYFEIVSTIALLIGWGAATTIKPGASIHADLNNMDTSAAMQFIDNAEKLSLIDFIQNIIPKNIVEPFIKGDMLQILFLAILSGIAIVALGEKQSKSFSLALEKIGLILFQCIRIIMYAAPIGVFGAMSYTIAKFGGGFLVPLFSLIATFYLTGIIFIFVVLGLIAKYCGFSIFRFIKLMYKELLLILGTSSSESALPQLVQKLESLGCKKETIGVVVPMGYSFNLDGTNIYITLAALFIAQALGIELTPTQEITIFATAMLTSKGAAGITGSGFITLAATLSVVPAVPAVGIVLILGIDRFMSEARALVNFIGNGVAAIAVSRWQGEVSKEELERLI